MSPRTVALLIHHERPEARALAVELCRALGDAGHHVRLPTTDAELTGFDELGVDDAELCVGGLDLAVAIGGDGTMLRTAHLVGEVGTPILGVNVGALGYLTEVEPAEAWVAVERVLAGDHRLEERLAVAVAVEAAGEWGAVPWAALNEAVVEKTPMGHTVRLAVSIDGDFWTTYAADGLIVASPTGSTAYSFSARGPIVHPRHRALVLTSVSPHMLFDRSLVLPPDTELRLEVVGHRPATLSVDGRNCGQLDEGDAIVCTAAARPVKLVTFDTRDFHGILKAKFGLADR